MDETAFEALWNSHYADILAFCLRRLGNRQEAADATAETFLIAWRRSSEVPESPRPWLFGVALKVIANSRRGGRRRGALALRLGATASPAFAALPDDSPGDVLAAFRTLAPADHAMTDVLELLRREDPVDLARLCADEPPQDRLEAILATSPGGPRKPGGTSAARRRRSLARTLLPAGAAAAIVAGALMLIAGGDGRSVDSAAAAALHRIAGVARAQPPTLPPGDPRFLYVRLQGEGFMAMAGERPFHRGIESADDFGFLLDFRHTQEVWVGESSGVVRNTATAPTFPTEGDRRAWEAAGRPKLPPANDDEFPLGQGIERLRIPTDTDALLAYLERRAAESDEGNTWIFATLITDYLREWGVTPDQRAALFEAAARLPGIELLGTPRDPAGRVGVGFAMDDEQDHTRHTLIIDPDTAELLAEISETLPGGPIPAGARSYTTFSSPVLVDAPGERPR